MIISTTKIYKKIIKCFTILIKKRENHYRSLNFLVVQKKRNSMQQLLLFEESKEEKLEREVKKIKDLSERSRKAQFAKIGELLKKYNEIEHELNTLKSAICRNEIRENLFY